MKNTKLSNYIVIDRKPKFNFYYFDTKFEGLLLAVIPTPMKCFHKYKDAIFTSNYGHFIPIPRLWRHKQNK